MATESTPLKRAFIASKDARSRWVWCPPMALIIFLAFVPKRSLTSEEVNTAVIINSILWLLTFGSLMRLVRSIVIGYNEYRYGDVIRRTGLSKRQLMQLLRIVPNQMYSPWSTMKLMRQQWSLEDFVKLYKSDRLRLARAQFDREMVKCSIYSLQAKYDGSTFDEEDFMRLAHARYEQRKRSILALTTIPA